MARIGQIGGEILTICVESPARDTRQKFARRDEPFSCARDFLGAAGIRAGSRLESAELARELRSFSAVRRSGRSRDPSR